MPFLLELRQNSRKNILGLFETEKNIISFLESLPFMEKDPDGQYFAPFSAMPELYTAGYNGWRYVFSRFSYSLEEGDIYADVITLCDLDKSCGGSGFVDGCTAVDGYIFPNDRAGEAIRDREALYLQAEEYFSRQGRRVDREGLGSQDGEYALVSDKEDPGKMVFAFHLDPDTVEEWKRAGSFELWADGRGL